MKNLQTLLIILAAVLSFTACEKEETSNLWNISGEIIMQDALTPEITTSLENIEVYLLNSPFTMDSITNWFTKTDILDSALTNADGVYQFSQLQAGDYVVMPADSTAGYFFNWSASPDSIWTSINNTQTDYKINFTTPEAVAVNSSNKFRFVFNVDGHTDHYIRIYRKRKSRKWDWYHFVWDKWKWHSIISYRGYNEPPYEPETFVHNEQEDDTYWHKYADEFRIEIGYLRVAVDYADSEHPCNTFDVVNLKQTNTWDVIWKEFWVKVDANRLD
jgi:hypothetical protein